MEKVVCIITSTRASLIKFFNCDHEMPCHAFPIVTSSSHFSPNAPLLDNNGALTSKYRRQKKDIISLTHESLLCTT